MNFTPDTLTRFQGPLAALAILIVGWFAAKLAKSFVKKLSCGLPNAGAINSSNLLGGLAYWVVLLITIGAVLSALNMPSVTQTLTAFTGKIFGYAPQVVGAVVIAGIGWVVSGLVAQLIVSLSDGLYDRVPTNRFIPEQTYSNLTMLASVLAKFAVLVPFIGAAADALAIPSISQPITGLVSTVLLYAPRVIGAAVVLALTWYVGDILRDLLKQVLAATKIDSLMAFLKTEQWAPEWKLSEVISSYAFYYAMLLAALEAVDQLGLVQVKTALGSLVAFGANVMLASVFALAALPLSNFVGSLMKEGWMRTVSKTAVAVFVGVMALSALGVAATIVNGAALIALTSLGVAVAIAFGVGGVDFAKNILVKFETKPQATPSSKTRG